MQSVIYKFKVSNDVAAVHIPSFFFSSPEALALELNCYTTQNFIVVNLLLFGATETRDE